MPGSTPPGERPEFVLPKRKRVTPWVKALLAPTIPFGL